MFFVFALFNRTISIISNSDEWKLLVISGKEFVGYLPKGVEVNQIKKITVIPITTESFDPTILDLEVNL